MRLKTRSKKNLIIVLVIIGLLIITFLVSFMFGRYKIMPSDVLKTLFSKIIRSDNNLDDKISNIIFNIRFPRIMAVCLVGASLSISGAVYQGAFQNTMASPDILGASQGAAFGAALAILLGYSSYGISLMAFMFSMVDVLIVYFVGQIAPGNKILSFVLSGIMVGSIFSSMTAFIKLIADPSSKLPAITYWMMGSFSGITNKSLLYALVPIIIGLLPLIFLRWRINILTLGDKEAISLGVNPARLRLIIIVCATLLTSTCVAISGMIGWVGLVIPHMLRKLLGDDNRLLLPTSCILGSLFLLIVDNISRNLLMSEIPIGILTSFVGAPFFIYLITKRKM